MFVVEVVFEFVKDVCEPLERIDSDDGATFQKTMEYGVVYGSKAVYQRGGVGVGVVGGVEKLERGG